MPWDTMKMRVVLKIKESIPLCGLSTVRVDDGTADPLIICHCLSLRTSDLLPVERQANPCQRLIFTAPDGRNIRRPVLTYTQVEIFFLHFSGNTPAEVYDMDSSEEIAISVQQKIVSHAAGSTLCIRKLIILADSGISRVDIRLYPTSVGQIWNQHGNSNTGIR